MTVRIYREIHMGRIEFKEYLYYLKRFWKMKIDTESHIGQFCDLPYPYKKRGV